MKSTVASLLRSHLSSTVCGLGCALAIAAPVWADNAAETSVDFEVSAAVPASEVVVPNAASEEAATIVVPLPPTSLQVLAGKTETGEAAKIAIARAQMLESAGVPELAEAQLRRTLKALPHEASLTRALAQLLERRERWAQASSQWREVLLQLRTDEARNAPKSADADIALRFEATRQLRAAQNHLLQTWGVADIVTLGANSRNPIAQNIVAEPLQATPVLANASAMQTVALLRPPSVARFAEVRSAYRSAVALLPAQKRAVNRLAVLPFIARRVPATAVVQNAVSVRDVAAVRAVSLRWENLWLERPMVKVGENSDNWNQSVITQTAALAQQVSAQARLAPSLQAPIKTPAHIWKFNVTVPGAHEAWLAAHQFGPHRRGE